MPKAFEEAVKKGMKLQTAPTKRHAFATADLSMHYESKTSCVAQRSRCKFLAFLPHLDVFDV